MIHANAMISDIFDLDGPGEREQIGESAYVLRGFALPYVNALMPAIDGVAERAEFRNMVTPGGFTMSVAMTNCGQFGWTTDRRGYRYAELDPVTGAPWPDMPPIFFELAHRAAAAADFPEFRPDACLINRYLPGNRLTLHQDKNETDFSAPIVSVSLGLPAVFLFGGQHRIDKAARVQLRHGDVAVWGGVDRLRFHGVQPLKDGNHPLLGGQRINFTFRKAG